MIVFQLIERNAALPKSGRSTAYLKIDNWNDFSFTTMFYLSLHDEEGSLHEIGNVKIGFKGQDKSQETHATLKPKFNSLPENYFSLGLNLEYYQKLSSLSLPLKEAALKSLNDMVYDHSFIDKAQDEKVFRTSLLRDTSLSIVKGQFKRVLSGFPPLTDFKFSFIRPKKNDMSDLNLAFVVAESSTPSTNIHAIIGRNGVGKTTLLNNMIDAITGNGTSEARFYDLERFDPAPISGDYFSSLVSVSFSAFDPFEPPEDQPDPSKGTCYFYIGLKDCDDSKAHKTIGTLRMEFAGALLECFRNKEKTNRWRAAIKKLGSDENFDKMSLEILNKKYKEIKRGLSNKEQSDSSELRKKYFRAIDPFLNNMSSGHAIVLLTITRLVATVEEKTLVLLDEPESHLHPPLLSAFIRALSDLLYDRNGVAIIATHSPVVLQEVPKSCVWKINRVGSSTNCARPEIETFGENVGLLTREVFGLEVSKSGFHDLLVKSVAAGKTYAEILATYQDQLGMEGRTILKTLTVHRDRGRNDD